MDRLYGRSEYLNHLYEILFSNGDVAVLVRDLRTGSWQLQDLSTGRMTLRFPDDIGQAEYLNSLLHSTRSLSGESVGSAKKMIRVFEGYVVRNAKLNKFHFFSDLTGKIPCERDRSTYELARSNREQSFFIGEGQPIGPQVAELFTTLEPNAKIVILLSSVTV